MNAAAVVREILRRRYPSCVHVACDFHRRFFNRQLQDPPALQHKKAQRVFAYQFPNAVRRITDDDVRVGDLLLLRLGKRGYHLAAAAATAAWVPAVLEDTPQMPAAVRGNKDICNPAAIFRDLVRGKRNEDGLVLYGLAFDDSDIDYASINAWFFFCQQYGLEFNGVFDSKLSVEECLNRVCFAGLAYLSFSSGKIGVAPIVPFATPNASTSDEDIVKDSFSISAAAQFTHDGVEATFRNREKNYEQDSVRATVPGVSHPTRFFHIDLFGITSPELARERAELEAYEIAYGWECEFELSATRIELTRGDVLLVDHPLFGDAGGQKVLVKEVTYASAGKIKVTAINHSDRLFQPLASRFPRMFESSVSLRTGASTLAVAPVFFSHAAAQDLHSFSPITHDAVIVSRISSHCRPVAKPYLTTT